MSNCLYDYAGALVGNEDWIVEPETAEEAMSLALTSQMTGIYFGIRTFTHLTARQRQEFIQFLMDTCKDDFKTLRKL